MHWLEKKERNIFSFSFSLSFTHGTLLFQKLAWLNNWHGEYIVQNIAFTPVSQLSRLIAYELYCNSLSSLHSLSADLQLTMQIVTIHRIGSFHTNHRAPKPSQIFTMTSIRGYISVNGASVIKLIKIATWYREVTRFNENIYASREVDGFGFDLT